MKLTDRTVVSLLEAFRSSDPTPGGGSASALVGAIGSSLLAMVASLPKPRVSSELEAERLAQAGIRCTELAAQLKDLIDRDSTAYDQVVDAYRLPKGTDEEKARRSAALQSGLTAATEAPLEVMRASAEALRLAATVDRLGNSNASSDVKVALHLLRAAIAGAAANVEINLGSLKDADYVARVRQEAGQLHNFATSQLPS